MIKLFILLMGVLINANTLHILLQPSSNYRQVKLEQILQELQKQRMNVSGLMNNVLQLRCVCEGEEDRGVCGEIVQLLEQGEGKLLHSVRNVLFHPCTSDQQPTLSNLRGNWISEDDMKVYIEYGEQVGEGRVQCPIHLPFYNGYECIQCPHLFNFYTKICGRCGYTQYYNPTTHTCITYKDVVVTRPIGVRLLGGQVSGYLDEMAKALRQVAGAKICPSAKPYSQGNHCIECAAPLDIYNVSSGRCIRCPYPGKFTSSSHECQGMVHGVNLKYVDRILGGDALLPEQGNNENKLAINSSEQRNISQIESEQTEKGQQQSTQKQKSESSGQTSEQSTGQSSGQSTSQSSGQVQKGRKQLSAVSTEQSCPDEAPFDNGYECIQCWDIFNLSSSQCTSCPHKTQFSPEVFNCTPLPPNFTNPTVNARVYYVKTLDSYNDILCPEITPFYNTTTCIQCDKPAYFFNQHTHACVEPPGNATNPAVNDRLVNGSVTFNNYDVYCKIDHPFFNGVSCVRCEKPLYLFDMISLECWPLPPNVTNRYWIDQVLGDVKEIDDEIDVECPDHKHFYFPAGNLCMNCEYSNQLFNQETGQCTTCPEGEKFNSTKHKCVEEESKMTRLILAGEWIANYPFKTELEYYQRVKSSTLEFCPEETPFFDGSECISCPHQEYFDLDSSMCKGCQEGTTYSQEFRKCAEDQISFMTDLENVNNMLYSDKSEGELLAIQDGVKQKYNASYCGPEQPFYDGEKCKGCPEGYPYFDAVVLDCVFCEEGTHYQANQCVDDGNGKTEEASLSKMIANIFSHALARHHLTLQH